MALLGLLFDQANAADVDVRGITEKAPISLLVVGLPCIVALHAHRFATAVFNDHFSAAFSRLEADGAVERVVVGVEDALERKRGRCIRRHCSAFFGTPDAGSR